MKTSQWIPTVVLICSVLTVGSAFAERAGGGRKASRKDPAGFFKKLDADGNGKVTRDEFLANAETRRKRFGKKRAANGSTSGKKSISSEKVFSKMDADSDGVLTQSEFTTALANRKQRRNEK